MRTECIDLWCHLFDETLRQFRTLVASGFLTFRTLQKWFTSTCRLELIWHLKTFFLSLCVCSFNQISKAVPGLLNQIVQLIKHLSKQLAFNKLSESSQTTDELLVLYVCWPAKPKGTTFGLQEFCGFCASEEENFPTFLNLCFHYVFVTSHWWKEFWVRTEAQVALKSTLQNLFLLASIFMNIMKFGLDWFSEKGIGRWLGLDLRPGPSVRNGQLMNDVWVSFIHVDSSAPRFVANPFAAPDTSTCLGRALERDSVGNELKWSLLITTDPKMSIHGRLHERYKSGRITLPIPTRLNFRVLQSRFFAQLRLSRFLTLMIAGKMCTQPLQV